MNNTEKDLILALIKNKKRLCTSYETGVPNCYTTHDNEADLFFIRRSGLCDEIEIKVSRSDLLADRKKRVHFRSSVQDDWSWREDGLEFAPYTKPKHEALLDGSMTCNYFWYAIKEGIGDVDDIPSFAGLISVCESGKLTLLKSPGRLHTVKLSDAEKYQIARKCSYRFWRSEFGVQF